MFYTGHMAHFSQKNLFLKHFFYLLMFKLEEDEPLRPVCFFPMRVGWFCSQSSVYHNPEHHFFYSLANISFSVISSHLFLGLPFFELLNAKFLLALELFHHPFFPHAKTVGTSAFSRIPLNS